MLLIKNSFGDFIKRPQIIFYSLSIFVLLFIFDTFIVLKAGTFLNGLSGFAHYVWLVLYVFVKMFVISIFAVLIIKSFYASKNNISIGLTFKNLILMIILLLAYAFIQLLNWLAFHLSKSISLPQDYFYVLTLIIQIGGLLVIVTFISLSNIFLVKEDISVFESVCSSIRFVKNNYIAVVSVLIIFAALLFLSQYLYSIKLYIFTLTELIDYALLYPLSISFLVNIINKYSN